MKLAKKARTPLSKFIIGIVDSVIDEDKEFKPWREVVREIETLKTENKALRDDIRQKIIVPDKYESELKRYRSQAFLGEDYQGVRRYSKELVEILKSRGFVDNYGLMEDPGIDPRESDLVKAVSMQLEELEGYSMIKPEGKGWRWIS